MIDAIAGIPLFGGFLATLVSFVAALGIVVFVHEYGHYIVARLCGIRSDVFSIGFGPVVWSRVDRQGTVWQVAALPLGGYVKFRGDSDGASRADPDALARMNRAERAESFHGASVGRRMLTVLAGPVFNFLLSIVLFAGLVLWQGVPTERAEIGEIETLPGLEQPLRTGDVLLAVDGVTVAGLQDLYRVASEMPAPGPIRVRIDREGQPLELTVPYPLPPKVQDVEPLSPASKAGLRAGDVVQTADGTPLGSFGDLRRVVLASGDRAIPITVWRDGDILTLSIVPKERDIEDGAGGFERRVMIGVAGAPLYYPATETPGPLSALAMGAERTWMVITQSLNGIRGMLTGAIGAENLQGPLGIAQVAGGAAEQGLDKFILIVAIVSTAIGLINLFPIPILDGGHFMAFLVEAVRGRPPSQQVMQVAMSIGLGLILLLMVFATYNDIIRMVS